MRNRLLLIALLPGLSGLVWQIAWFGPWLRPKGIGWPPQLAVIGGYFVLMVIFVLLARRWKRRVRRRLVGTGCRVCFGCGYDLSGLPDDGACPECGEAYLLWALRERWFGSGLCTRAECAGASEP